MSRLVTAFCSFFILATLNVPPAIAQLLEGDDLILTDSTPDIVFDDTDTVGWNWVIRGRDANFEIDDEANGYPYLRISTDLWGVSLGRDASSSDYNIALGASASAAGPGSSALGFQSSAAASDSMALGRSASVLGTRGTALGAFAAANGSDSLALGRSSLAEGTGSTAVGFRALATQPQTIVVGAITGVNGATAYHNVGMGTDNPTQAVEVERSASAARFQLTSFTNTSSEAPQYIQRRARGTRTAPSAVQANDNLGLFSFRGYTPSGFGGSRATITAQAASKFADDSTPTRLIFATTPVGQTTPVQVMVITPDGKVQVNGQNLTVPDYVFEDDYELMPLEELRSFIGSNGHLPGIASASDISAEGLDLAGSHLAHLRKIEELTLYTLDQESRLEAQQLRIEELERQMTQLVQVTAQH